FTIAEQGMQTFQADHLELSVRADESEFTFSQPAQSGPIAREPELFAPLQTARGRQGEIRLWREARPFGPSEERLLRTFASQGALALERARLVKAERRARVSEESDRLKTALLSSVSHELRTPLATIKASVTSLRSGAVTWDSSARQDLLAAIEEETDHLNQLVGNLLDMSRIETGALQPERKWNILAEIVNGAIARMRGATQSHRVVNEVSEDLPLAPVDYVQIEQVFINLIGNSLKYAPAGTAIRISARVQHDQWLRVQVSNEGPPVPEEHLARIFDKFYQVTNAGHVTGTGLGLSICKGIVEAHGGRIWAENLAPSGGFAFNFTLPLTWQGRAPSQAPTEREAA
ncbi:MAG: ATP-binding protein, partial [Anaerolineales bacterium]